MPWNQTLKRRKDQATIALDSTCCRKDQITTKVARGDLGNNKKMKVKNVNQYKREQYVSMTKGGLHQFSLSLSTSSVSPSLSFPFLWSKRLPTRITVNIYGKFSCFSNRPPSICFSFFGLRLQVNMKKVRSFFPNPIQSPTLLPRPPFPALEALTAADGDRTTGSHFRTR